MTFWKCIILNKRRFLHKSDTFNTKTKRHTSVVLHSYKHIKVFINVVLYLSTIITSPMKTYLIII